MSKAKPFTGVRPIRNDGRGWVVTEPHRAQAWAAVIRDRVLDRFPSKASAELLIEANTKRKAKPLRDYRLGKRMEKPATDNPIRRELTGTLGVKF